MTVKSGNTIIGPEQSGKRLPDVVERVTELLIPGVPPFCIVAMN